MNINSEIWNRLIECGILSNIRPESYEKMKKGAILLIDRRGVHDDEITWFEKGMVLREGKFKQS